MAKIAFLGAGMMGQTMIRNFLGGGHDVTVYNRTLEKARPLEALGAVLALPDPPPAEAQAPASTNEQIQIMRDMSASLKGIEQAVRQKCP